MGLVGVRQSFATALSTADGVNGYLYRPAAPKAGDAWPILSELERADGAAYIATWRVKVWLPQDERAASQWIDAHLEDLHDALRPVGFTDRFAATSEPVEGTPTYLLEITVRSM